MRIYEARRLGTSQYVYFAKRALRELEKRARAVDEQNFRFVRDACKWAKERFNLPMDMGCEEVFISSEYITPREVEVAVRDFTSEYGKPHFDDHFEEIYSWDISDYFTIQIFNYPEDETQKPFIIVFHNYGMDLGLMV